MQKPVREETQQRYAVCIGINHYSSSTQLNPLCCAEHDAHEMYNLFLQRGFAQEQCCLLVGPEATTQAIREALQTFVLTKPKKNDLVIFYFAGHGVPLLLEDEDEPASDVFLASYDFDRPRIEHERGAWLDYPLRLGRLRQNFFELTRSKKVLFLLDSCHSGDFFGSKYREDASARHFIDQSFARMSAGRVVLSSSMPQQLAYEDQQLGHGRFTYHVLQALSGRIRDAVRRDGFMTVSSLFDFLAKTMPQTQTPVESGVKHGSFELLYYPEFDEATLSSAPAPAEGSSHEEHKKQRLRAMLADHRSFLRDRLESFVGRQAELIEIRARIAEKLQIGGYVTITGQAGQGKSSIIAKLIAIFQEEQGLDQVAFHFIPLNPGPDHQVGLLRNLMARLILKYDLPDLYVASESRPALRDYFPRVLEEVVARRGQEVIFVDGLDQLEEEFTGQRDLSFLPNNPPMGIVFVLGTRPNG